LATKTAPKKNARPQLTALVIDALEDIKAKDIKLINVAKITSVSDYIAIASADSTRQTRALANNVIEKVKEAGYTIHGSEGGETGEWVLVDCGDVVVHIMQPAVREYYKLEELWQDGKVEFPKPVAAKKPATTKARADAEPAPKVAKKPTAKKVATKKPAAKKPAAKKVAAKTPTTKSPAGKKPATKKPAAKVAKVAKKSSAA
jgi:ribosome-associated protein